MSQVKLKYVGSIKEVAVKGIGIVKYGDIISVDEKLADTFSSSNWERIQLPGFDRKVNSFNKANDNKGERIQ